MALELTDQNFESEVLKNILPVLVDFWAPWCGPCQVMGPIVEELAKEVEGKAKVGKVNVDENPALAEKYGILSIPSIKIFKGGQVVKEFTGAQSKMILKNELGKV
jgi:thioredoxin 1